MITIPKFIASGFCSGLTPKAPGTFGSLGYFLFWFILSNFNLINQHLLNASLIIITIIAGFISIPFELKGFKTTDHKNKIDPQYIVIDEWAGLAIALSLSTANIYSLIPFVLFRVFDISKFWPTNKLEKLPGATGIMLDDFMAGIYALILNLIILNVFKII